MKIYIPEFKAMAKCNQHLDHPAFDIEIDDDLLVKHGEWKIAERDMTKHTVIVECSECNALLELPMYALGLNYNFCPNCGAKMDGGKTDAPY